MFLLNWYRERRDRRRAQQRLAELMDELAHLSAERRRAAGAWRSPTLRTPIGIHPDPGGIVPVRAPRSRTLKTPSFN